MPKTVTIIDYGMGNMWSIASAVEYLGYNAIITQDPEIVRLSEALILPGVGSFGEAVSILNKTNLDEAIIDAVKSRGSKILGICLGMQLLATSSTEGGLALGLNLISKKVTKFNDSLKLKIPHVGFNTVYKNYGRSILFNHLPEEVDFYFVHSYQMPFETLLDSDYKCIYGTDFLAAYERDNIFATQFHPEKSQRNGLVLLENFLRFQPC